MAEPPRGRQQHFLFHGTGEIEQAFRLAAPPIEEPLVMLLLASVMMMIMMVVTMMPVLMMAAAALVMIKGALSARGSPAAALSEFMMALRIGRILMTFGGCPAIGGMSGHAVCRRGRRGFASLSWLPVLAASGGAYLSSGHYFGRAAHGAGFAASAFCLLLG
jgi:hypothetical protein